MLKHAALRSGPDRNNRITLSDGINSAIVNYVTQVAGSLVFTTNKLNMQQTGYTKVTFSGPAGDVPIIPAQGLVPNPISADIDQVLAWTKDDLQQTFVFQSGIVKFGPSLTVSVKGQSQSSPLPMARVCALTVMAVRPEC